MGSMLTPEMSAIILLIVSIVLLIVIPLLDGSTRFARYVSLRYTLVTVALIMSLGCVLDFSHLNDSSRNIALMGGLILVGVFVAVRSLEKLKIGNKVIEISAEMGDKKLTTKLQNKGNVVEESPDNKSDKKDEPSKEDTNDEFKENCSEEVECVDPDEDVKTEDD
jgi:uncharacterized protein YebE (UPF0316 family)